MQLYCLLLSACPVFFLDDVFNVKNVHLCKLICKISFTCNCQTKLHIKGGQLEFYLVVDFRETYEHKTVAVIKLGVVSETVHISFSTFLFSRWIHLNISQAKNI